ncbi:MAG: polynucleotide adenylyltransferase, partial [Acidobacteriota bacterium]|nr:polynucleotide adenylyltransferase [Acidobacteriota bacterium]
SKTGRGHRGFVVEGDPQMSFTEAARRRDFTINAMMYDPLADDGQGEYIDLYGGLDDLKRGVIRVVDPATFVEDSLRVLRAMQFAARFEFTIDPATIDLCRSIDLSDLPAERIWAEVEKWLLQSRRPSIGLQAARELGIMEKLWPEVHALAGCPKGPTSHPEGQTFWHTGMVLDEARKLIDDLRRPKQIAVLLGALCHGLGKPLTGEFLGRMKLFTFDNYDVRKQALALVEHHAVPRRWGRAHQAGETITDGMFRRLALKVEPDLLYRVALADCLARVGDFKPELEEWFLERVRELGIEQSAPQALLLGRHVLALGLLPGKRIGEITRAVYELQLDGKVVTLDDAIAAARQMI